MSKKTIKIQVLGSGCPTCKKLHEITQRAVSDLGEDVELEYLTGVEGTSRIIELGAMSSPLLVVNDKIAMTGFNSDINEIKAAINKAAQGK